MGWCEVQDITIPTSFFLDVEGIPNARHRVYVAKIIGSHPEYILERQFLDLECTSADNVWYYSAELEDYGVYEYSVKWFSDYKKDEDDDGFLYGYRGWFMVVYGFIHHYIPLRDSVLPELQKLKKYLRKMKGDGAA